MNCAFALSIRVSIFYNVWSNPYHCSSDIDSKKKVDDEADWELQERCKSRCIWVTGEKGLTEYEAAVLIVQEAKKLIADDLHQMGVEWKPLGRQ